METKPHQSAHFLRMCKRMPFITKAALSGRDLRRAASGPVSLRNRAGRSHVGKTGGQVCSTKCYLCFCGGRAGQEEGHGGRQRQRRRVIDIRDLALPPDPAGQPARAASQPPATLNSLNSLEQDGCFWLHPLNPTAAKPQAPSCRFVGDVLMASERTRLQLTVMKKDGKRKSFGLFVNHKSWAK